MKKIISILMVSAVLLALCACAKKENNDMQTTTTESSAYTCSKCGFSFEKVAKQYNYNLEALVSGYQSSPKEKIVMTKVEILPESLGENKSDATYSDEAAKVMKEDYLKTIYSDFGVDFSKNVKVKITVENYGDIELELYPDVAPVSVRNFAYLAKQGFYDGLIFHRVIDGFMIQGGDPAGTGTGGSENSIYGEFSENGFENKLAHEAGVVSMARTSENNSASSQFFICDDTSSHLDGQYAAFGKVTSGLDIVHKIADCEKSLSCPQCGNIIG